jgi:hypothetical protein
MAFGDWRDQIDGFTNFDFAYIGGNITDRRAARQEVRDARNQERIDRREGRLSSNDPSNPTPVNNGTQLSPQEQAFQTFYDSKVYQFPLEQGLEAINANYAARGALESGAAQKAIVDYAGNTVAAGAFRDYMSYLGNQQGIGLGAASAQVGVGQGYANSITAANNNYAAGVNSANSAFANNASGAAGNLGNAYGQGAINAGNINAGAINAQANNTNSMIQGVGNAFGNAAGAFAYQPYSSYARNPSSGWGTPGIY